MSVLHAFFILILLIFLVANSFGGSDPRVQRACLLVDLVIACILLLQLLIGVFPMVMRLP